jgi:type VI secretion system secreted protein VgrG
MFNRITATLPVEGLLFWKLKGSEALSQPFSLNVTLLGSDARVERHALLGQPLTLAIPTGLLLSGGVRYLNGKITRVAVHSEELGGTRYAVYELSIEPDLWPMKRDKNSRIFQEQTAVQIIHQLLAEYNVQVEDRLTGSYRVWEYCVQYQESSFDFISRLMELEGIYYWFRHEAERHIMVLSDAPEAHEPFPGYESIAYHLTGSGGVTGEQGVSHWALEDRVTPGLYSIDDYDFRKPHAWLLQARQNPAAPQPGQTEVFEWPGRFVEHAQGEKYVRVRQEEWQAAHRQISGKGTALGIAPGYTFTLRNAPHIGDNGQYLTLSAHYRLEENRYASGGEGNTVHEITFRVLPAEVVFRPEPVTEWPKTHGPQTARVVGPKGESIHTDRYGRIKVKFHWDRLAKGDETSSCWVRVSSAWAGQGYGGVQIPRVNDEVVIDFINGDPDRPIVTGRVYNEGSMPPWSLPGAATQMGFLSRSKDGTPGNANALRFEDKAGAEQVWLQAERNMDVNVKNDASCSIGSHHSHYVRKNELHRVEAGRLQAVKGGYEILTGKGKSDAVVEPYVLASGTQLRLICGESALELNANGQINIVGKGFNLFVEGDGHITTSGGKLNLNSAGSSAGTTAPGSSHKNDIQQAVKAQFAPEKKDKDVALKKASSSDAPSPSPSPSPSTKSEKTASKSERIDDRVVRSVMASEGATGEQGGRPELYGFRKGNGKNYDNILAARNKYGIGSQQEFNAVSDALSQSAKNAGALNFTDPGKQAAITSLAHMRGSGGAQAVLNSMVTGDIIKSDTLKLSVIEKLETMSPEEFQKNLVKARVAYDKKIYGNTITTQGGKRYNWWGRYGNGL